MGLKQTAIVVLVCAVAGCDLFGGSAEGCDDPLRAPELGQYVLRVTDDEGCRTYSPSRAHMNPSIVDRGLRSVVYFQFEPLGEESIELFMAKQVVDSLSIEETLPEGSYPVADLEHADPPYPGRFDTYEENFSVSGWDEEGNKIYSRSGVVTVTGVNPEVIEGDFSITLQWNGTSDQMKAKGRFKAREAQLGWIGFW